VRNGGIGGTQGWEMQQMETQGIASPLITHHLQPLWPNIYNVFSEGEFRAKESKSFVIGSQFYG
jgi:hypothetical protein